MPKKKIEAVPSPRPDVGLKGDDFIAEIRRPNFDLTRSERVIQGYKNGLPLESLMRSTGFSPTQIFSLLDLDEVAENQKFQKLTEVYEKRVKQW